MADDYETHAMGLTSPAQGVFNPTLHDSNTQPHVSRAIRCASAGTLKLTGKDGVACSCKFGELYT